MKLKLFIKILFIIFLLATIFSCKKDLIPKKEFVGLVRVVESPWYGSMSSAFLLFRQERANGEVHYMGHVYTNGQQIPRWYYFDEVYEKVDMSEYVGKIIRVKAYPTNGYLGMHSITYLLEPEVIEVKDIDYSVISENYGNPDSYIWK